MSENGTLHWTDDDDLLSEYAMGRITGEEAKKLESHLSTCPKCREAVGRERAIASGVRRYGRDQLKSRLNTMISRQPGSVPRLVTWQRAVSAAAVLAIVAGIGILNGWFTSGQRGLFSTHAERPEPSMNAVHGTVDSSRAQKDANAPIAHELATAQPRTEIEGGKTTSGKADEDRTKESGQTGLVESLRDERRSEDAIGAAGGEKKAKVAAKELDEMTANSVSKSVARELWAGGGALPQVQTFGEKSGPARKLFLQAEPSAQQQLGGGGVQKVVVTDDFPGTRTIEFKQSKMEQLPVAKQRVAEQEPAQVQTLFRLTGRRTDVTLYLDTLFSEEDLHSASVKRISPDSIVIVIKSKQLGYHLPADFLNSVLGSWKKE